MEYRKIINLLDNTLNQRSKFRTKKWVKIKGESQRTTTAITKLDSRL